jgi:hypothetical protein
MNAPTTRAGWLKFLREHGQDPGGTSNLATILGIYPIKVKEAVDPLVVTGYVQMVGKPGRGGGFKYISTTLGFRYLNENQEELDEEADTDTEDAPDIQTPAPTPVPSSPPEQSPGAEHEPSIDQPAERPDLDRALKDALFDELFERFGDQVSAKQLLERMRANASRVGDDR